MSSAVGGAASPSPLPGPTPGWFGPGAVPPAASFFRIRDHLAELVDREVESLRSSGCRCSECVDALAALHSMRWRLQGMVSGAGVSDGVG